MLDLKQLQYFIVSADVESFSEAAKILYTTQSNVSKSVSALEKTLGVQLFYRESRGIKITSIGKHIYEHAMELLDAAESLESHANSIEADWFNISANPSEWFSKHFAEFYNKYYNDNLHIRVQSGSTWEVVDRVKESKDEIGFVYVSESDSNDVNYYFQRNHLRFYPITEVNMYLHLGKKNVFKNVSDLTKDDLDNLRFIQLYQDEISKENNWIIDNNKELKLEKIHAAVITNSDYIKEQMIKNTSIANISSDDNGIPICRENSKTLFGYIKRENEDLSKTAKLLIEFLKSKIK